VFISKDNTLVQDRNVDSASSSPGDLASISEAGWLMALLIGAARRHDCAVRPVLSSDVWARALWMEKSRTGVGGARD